MWRAGITIVVLCVAATSQTQSLVLCVDADGHAAIEAGCLPSISLPCEPQATTDGNQCGPCCFDCEDCHDVALGSEATAQRLRYEAYDLPIAQVTSSPQFSSFPLYLVALSEMPIIALSFPVLRI